MKSGEDYIELKQTISINILNFNLFKCSEPYSKFALLEKTQEPAIRKAVIKLHEMSEDEKTKEIARSREKWLHDRVSALGYAKRTGMAEGMEKGHAKGLAEGEEKAKKEMIDKMRLSGMTEEQIRYVINIDI